MILADYIFFMIP